MMATLGGGGGGGGGGAPLNEILDSYNIYSAWYSVLPTTSDIPYMI